MITGSEQDSRRLMMNAAIKIVAGGGFEGFTTKKWASIAGVAEGSLYLHFKSKDDLLEQTFFYIDHQIAAVFDRFVKKTDFSNLELLVSQLWDEYFGFLIDNPEATLYYYRFRTTPRYNVEVQREQFTYFGSFIGIMNKLNDIMELYKKISWNVLWTYVIDTTTAFAFRVITGGIPNNDSTEKMMLGLFEDGILGIFKMPSANSEELPEGYH